MPIFEPDGGRPRLVQPMQPLAGTFLGEVRTLLAEHLEAVVGEPLFPIRARAALPEHTDVPELLALDVTGRPVVLEVAQVVDDAAIVDTLRHAGAAARLTTADLARAYHSDPTRFSADYAAFRDKVPFARPAEPRYGTRLVLLCSEVAAESVDTLAAVRGPGWPVEVLQVGVVRGPDGQRLLDVSPLAAYEPSRRPVEPTSLRLVHGAQPGSAPMTPVPLDLPEERGFIPTQPPVLPSALPYTSAPPHPRPGPQPSRPAVPFTRPLAPLTRSTSSLAALIAAPARHERETALPSEQAFGPPTPVPAASAQAAPVAAPDHVGRSTPTVPATPVPAAGHAGYTAAAAALPELARLAATVRAPTPLVWVRVRRGQRLEATLRPDGLIQLADGSLFADPDLAAARAAHSEGVVDGWRVWRLGDGGLTLAEVTGR